MTDLILLMDKYPWNSFFAFMGFYIIAKVVLEICCVIFLKEKPKKH